MMFSFPYAPSAFHHGFPKGYLTLRIRQAQKEFCMTPRKFARANFLLYLFRKAQKAQTFANIGLSFAAYGADTFLSPVLTIKLIELLKPLRLFNGVQVLALEIFHQPLGGGFPFAD